MSTVNLTELAAALSAMGIEVQAEDTPAPKSRTKRKSATRPTPSAKASAARKPSAKVDYVPTNERRADLPTAKMLWALNAKGMITLRKSAGQPLTFGACWDARAGIEG